MKKLILFLMPFLAMAQNPTNFPYGIKNTVAPTNSTPTYVITQEVDGVHKKTPAALFVKTAALSDSLDTRVPYTGALQNVDLGEYGVSGGYLKLDTTPTSIPTTLGAISWDATYRTASLIDGFGDTNLQIGQEQRILVHNGTGVTITDGQVVYVTGSTGQFPSVALANASSHTTSATTIGVATETIPNGQAGFITTGGLVNGLNTLAFNESDLLWLSTTSGQFTNVAPTSPNHLVLIGYVIKKSGGNGSILVKIQNTQELSECSDVLFTALTNNDVMVYESATSLWKNKSISTILGYTPANDTNVVKKFIKSNESLSLAQRKGDVLYGILDQYTGEEITLSKVTGTPTVDGIIYFQLGSEYFKRNTDGIFNVKWFDAKGDGTTDDTVSIQKAIDIAIAGTEIFIPNGVYMIKATGDLTSGVDGGLRINKSLKIHLDLKTTLKAITGNKNQGQVIYCYDTSGIEIYGGEIIGDRDTNTNLAEWGHGIGFWNVSKIYVHDIKISKCKGDNIEVGTNAVGLNYDTVIERVIFDSPRRWGFTYASGGKRLTIKDCVFQNFTTDLGFGGGMDLEEHYATDEMNDVTIEGCKFINTTSPNGDITIQGYNVKNWKIINNSFSSTATATPYGINMSATTTIHSLLINGNDFLNYTNTITINSPNTQGLVLGSNYFLNCSIGIQLGGNSTTVINEAKVTQNTFQNVATCINQLNGILKNCIFLNNTFDTYTTSINVSGEGHSIDNNKFLNGASGIVLGLSKSIFSNNFVKNATGNGVAVSSVDSVFKGNTITGCVVGFQIPASASNNIFEGNNLSNCSTAVINAPVSSISKSYFIFNNTNGGTVSIDASHYIINEKQLRSIMSDGIAYKIFGSALNGTTDLNGGFLLGMKHNASGNRQFFIGGSDSPQKFIFSGRSLNIYNSTTDLFEPLSLNTNMAFLNVGFATNAGLVAVSNHSGSASSKVMILEGVSGQTGDYLNILERGGAVKVSVNSAGNLLIPSATISTAPTTSAGTYDILTRNSSTGVVEKVTSTSIAPTASPTFTGIPTAPTATVGTNTTQIATTAFVQGIRPYKVYTALLSQTGTSAPTATVLENTLGGTVVWTYSTVGGYIGTLTGAFTNNKTSVLISNGQAANALFGSYRLSDNAVGLFTTTAGTGAAVDGAIFNATIEIRVYN